MKRLLLSVGLMALACGAARADSFLWIDDTSGNIGEVDVTTKTFVAGSLHATGQSLTDIAFIGSQMYGTSFFQLFTINDASGATALVGTYIVGNSGMNALVGSGSALLGASFTTNEVYIINPSNAAGFNFAPSPLRSAGDLACSGCQLFGGQLILSATNGSSGDSLVNVSTDSVVGAFVPPEKAVDGIANDGTTTYAVDGTEIFTVDVSDAVLTPFFDYSGNGLAMRKAPHSWPRTRPLSVCQSPRLGRCSCSASLASASSAIARHAALRRKQAGCHHDACIRAIAVAA